MTTENVYAYMLHNIPGWGNKTLLKLLDEFGSCSKIAKATEKELRDFITSKQYKAFERMQKTWDLEGEYEYLYRRGIDFYYYSDVKYPRRLKDIPDPPFALYCLGNLPDENKPSVSIIGARNSSEYGKYAAKLFGDKLALSGIQIISGMARGIDGISQQAAIYAGGESYGILGSGVDVCYPEENRALYNSLIKSGGIISEYLPGTQPKPQYFPPRNRIISGLSDAVLVIEAREKSGTLITVDMALEQGREVFAVPGRICDSLSYGCNSLIRQGAGMAAGPEEILEYLRRKIHSDRPGVDEKCGKEEEKAGEMCENIVFENNEKAELLNCNETQKCIYKELDFYPQTTAAIFEKMVERGMEMTVSEVMNALVELCLIGIVAQNGTGFYKRG
ncbi:DNA-processing protein DprA [Butyrivibrio sp. LC3010]|uniref:DNA-processing protein DprA n=1 Tax=Butyrivibrio sp. LC3010 TaxID=1280680 RepID=UPI00040AD536|nr:DNA-processing protein DprA [Butyrivibrio sp. LC3010]